MDEEFAGAQERAGISVAVYADGVLWTYALGEASSTANMTASTPIPIGSTSKTFVSALVLTQIEQGLYEVTDSLGQVLSGHPDYESFDKSKINADVTVAQMLSMRSGLPNYNDNRDGVSGLFKSATWKPADNINLVQDAFVETGAFDYNDTNLVLLGLIAEFQGGQSLGELYRQTFFDPLGIWAVLPPRDGVPSDTAHPYGDLAPFAEGFGNIVEVAPYDLDHYWLGQSRIRWPCCGLISTPENLARWGYNLYSTNGSALTEPARAMLLESLLSDPVMYQGVMQNYGYMTTQRTYEWSETGTIATVGHPGGGGGYSTLMRYAPELDLTVVVLANSLLQESGTCSAHPTHRDVRHCLAARIFAAYAQHSTTTSTTVSPTTAVAASSVDDDLYEYCLLWKGIRNEIDESGGSLQSAEEWTRRIAWTEQILDLAPAEYREAAETYLGLVKARAELLAQYDYVGVRDLPSDIRTDFIEERFQEQQISNVLIDFSTTTCLDGN